MTPVQARTVWKILCQEAQASSRPEDTDSFVFEFTGPDPTREWRFCGSLGFGGKFRFPRMSVDCYPEDLTPARANAIKNTNVCLAALREEWSLQTSTPTG